MSLLRTESRDKVGTASTVGQPPERPEKADSFHELTANFCSLKTENIPDGRLVLGDYLGATGSLLEWALPTCPLFA